MVSALAIVCIRNEVEHVGRLLTSLIEDGVDVVCIDHESTDGSRETAAQFIGKGLLAIETLKWSGKFCLTTQMEYKNSVANRYSHDWLIHIDADEWLCSPGKDQSLLEGLSEADADGANCVNFNELVFVPCEMEKFEGQTCHQNMLRYYFFQPTHPRLMRAWNRSSGLDNRFHAGHLLAGEGLRLYQHDFILRHYICLSQEQACRKYLTRTFSQIDVEKGWHGNRRNITENNLILPSPEPLLQLPNWDSKDFDVSSPYLKHFWEW